MGKIIFNKIKVLIINYIQQKIITGLYSNCDDLNKS